MYGDQMVRMPSGRYAVHCDGRHQEGNGREARGGQADSRSAPRGASMTSTNRLCAEVNRRILARSVTYLFQ